MTPIEAGTPIVTTKSFEYGEGLKGVVLNFKKPAYAILFEKQQKNYHNLDDRITTDTGYYLKKTNFNATKIDPVARAFYMSDLNNWQKTPIQIRREEKNLDSWKNEITMYESHIKKDLEKVEKTKKIIEDLKNTKIPEITDSTETIATINKHKKVSLLTYKQIDGIDYFVIETEPLYYHLDGVKQGLLGQYVLFVHTSFDSVYGINKSVHFFNGEIHHPCIDHSRTFCLGNFSQEIVIAQRTKDIYRLINSLILFLEEPNYGSPYVTWKTFQRAQPVDKPAEDYSEYFDRSFWEKQTWDKEADEKKRTELDEKFEDEDAHEDYDSNEEAIF